MKTNDKTMLLKIASMTGFGSSEGVIDGVGWTWEVRSVNGKGLDIRCRLPLGYEKLDVAAKLASGKIFKRGNLNLNLIVHDKLNQNQYKINRTLLNQLIETVEGLQTNLKGFDKPRLEGLLAVRGVIEPMTESEAKLGHLTGKEKILTSLDEALSSLCQSRIEEGTRIAKVLFNQLKKINRLCRRAEKIVAIKPADLRIRLKRQIDELLDSVNGLSEDRLAQEAAILMIKSDVREELDRLSAHVDSAKMLMEKGGPIGRKLDFLCQEFNREVNTLCSKASDINLSKIGLELKALIEQFREQVANIE